MQHFYENKLAICWYPQSVYQRYWQCCNKELRKRKTSSLVLEFGNKVYLNSDFDLAPGYKQILNRDFTSDIESADFRNSEGAAGQINSWVANVTHYRVPGLLTPGRRIFHGPGITKRKAWPGQNGVSNETAAPNEHVGNSSGITTTEDTLSVSNIIHKAELEVNEKGGTASAATGVLVATLSLVLNPDELEFNANHPFLAIIVHRVNSVPLFAETKSLYNWYDLLLYKIVALVLGFLVSASTAKGQNELSVATNKFSFQLLQEIFKEQGNENVISSPVSLSTLLSILLQGAAGNTQKQLVDVLHLDAEKARSGFSKLIGNYKSLNDNTTLEFANGLFLSDAVQLVENFKKVVQNDFRSQEYSVNFSNKEKSAEIINKWASDNTHGLIPTLFTPGRRILLPRSHANSC
ncbi:hypothetical protein C0J52_11367 [Blattella germanica]|nr:hypothetical protein C0J52_11367 [Blattella germanica]